jgi:hypothetical protein
MAPAPADLHRFPAATAADRGLPPIEFRFRSVDGLVVNELPASGESASAAVITCEERGPVGRLVGTIEIGLFSASLIIDRAGVLQDLATTTAAAALAGPARGRLLGQGEVELSGGASGYRVDAVLQLDEDGRFRPDCPYASWLALAGPDAVARGGVFAVIRSAGPDWRAAAELLDSLEIGGSGARPTSGGGAASAQRLNLPLVRHR